MQSKLTPRPFEVVNPQPALHERALEAARSYSQAQASLIEILQEVEATRTHFAMGYSSLFRYATEALDITEALAYTLISLARKAREIPQLQAEIQEGSLSVSKAARIASVISPENHNEWIEKAKSLSKDDLEKQVAAQPQAERHREFLRRVGEAEFSFRTRLSEKDVQLLKRAQNLISSSQKQNVSLTESLAQALDFYLEKKDPLRKKWRSESRPPQIEKRERQKDSDLEPQKITLSRKKLSPRLRALVTQRDRGRCQYKISSGKACGSERFLEVHHRIQVAQGGQDRLENLITLCSAHHRLWHASVESTRSDQKDGASTLNGT